MRCRKRYSPKVKAARRAARQLRAQQSTRKGHATSVKLHRVAAMSLTDARRVAVGKEEQRRERALTFEKSRSKRYIACSDVVPVVGLEPTRYRYQRILSPSRLPFHHYGISTELSIP